VLDEPLLPEDEEPEPTLLQLLVAKAKKVLGLDDIPAESTAGQAMEGAGIVADLVKRSRGPQRDKDGLIVGSSRGVIHENVRTLRAKGMSEAEAIKLAQAAADRAYAAEQKGKK